MNQLLFGVVFLEMALIVVLLFRSPLRMLLILGLDQMRRGRGRLVAGTVATTMVVVFGSAVHDIMGVQRRLGDATVINPTDEVLMANRLLEASLIGFSLFLGILIDRLHCCLNEPDLWRGNMEAIKARERDNVERERIGSLRTRYAIPPRVD